MVGSREIIGQLLELYFRFWSDRFVGGKYIRKYNSWCISVSHFMGACSLCRSRNAESWQTPPPKTWFHSAWVLVHFLIATFPFRTYALRWRDWSQGVLPISSLFAVCTLKNINESSNRCFDYTQSTYLELGCSFSCTCLPLFVLETLKQTEKTTINVLENLKFIGRYIHSTWRCASDCTAVDRQCER